MVPLQMIEVALNVTGAEFKADVEPEIDAKIFVLPNPKYYRVFHRFRQAKSV
jgi:hypothetical protein